jgi:hypothetical protein
MKKTTARAKTKVNVTFCVQLSEDGQRNEIKKGRSGKLEVLIKGQISPDDVDLFRVDADGRKAVTVASSRAMASKSSST